MSSNISIPAKPRQILHVGERRAFNEDGGYLTANVWQTRHVGDIFTNLMQGASISNNLVILPAGSYLVTGRSFHRREATVNCRLFDKTANRVLVEGQHAYNKNSTAGGTGTSCNSTNFLHGYFEITQTTSVAWQTYTVNHPGRPTSSNAIDYGQRSHIDFSIYTNLLFEKV